MSVFSRISGNHPRRNVFNLSYDVKTTADMGQLIPIMCDEVIPGDTFKISNQVVVRFAPLVAPTMHEVSLFTHYFFVPYRLLWSEWEDFITGGKDGDYTGAPPQHTSTGLTDKGTLWDYFGFPVNSSSTMSACSFPFNAYNLVWNEYYRDENLDDEVDLNNREILYRRWRKDYFTSALPFQQRGTSPAFVFGNLNASINFQQQSNMWQQFGDILAGNRGSAGASGRVVSTGSSLSGNEMKPLSVVTASNINANGSTLPNPIYVSDVASTQYTNVTGAGVLMNANDMATLDNVLNNILGSAQLSADGTASGGFNIADIRLGVQIQRFMELNARAGVRYTEFLRAHFGVSPTDARLDRPEFIGGSRSPVLFNEVLQTSSTDSVSPQGNMAGRGITADRSYIGKYRVQEFGLIIGILSVMPRATYQQGINRQWLRQTRYDYYFPEFAHLSEQAIENREIYAEGTPQDMEIFGFQGRYNEMRFKPSLVTGQMRDTFDYWHLGRKFADRPLLNSSFLECKPDKRIFAAQTEPSMFIWFANHIKAARPLPKISTPGFIDHA